MRSEFTMPTMPLYVLHAADPAVAGLRGRVEVIGPVFPVQVIDLDAMTVEAVTATMALANVERTPDGAYLPRDFHALYVQMLPMMLTMFGGKIDKLESFALSDEKVDELAADADTEGRRRRRRQLLWALLEEEYAESKND